MKFVAEVRRDSGKVIISKEDGEVREVSLNVWDRYLSKCMSNGAAYLCKRAAMISKGDVFVGVVTEKEPRPEDVSSIEELARSLGLPEFLLEDLISLMYIRDAMFDLSCVGCEQLPATLAIQSFQTQTSESYA